MDRWGVPRQGRRMADRLPDPPLSAAELERIRDEIHAFMESACKRLEQIEQMLILAKQNELSQQIAEPPPPEPSA